MSYTDLTQLLSNSSSTRRYFLSLPVDLQLELHKKNEFIHSAAELHDMVNAVARNAHYDSIAGFPHEYSLY